MSTSRRSQEDTVAIGFRISKELDNKLRSRAWPRGFNSAGRYAESLLTEAIKLEEEKERTGEIATFRRNAPLDIRDIV